MHDHLATYLQDHLAGAVVGVNLLESLRDEHAGQPVGECAGQLLAEVECDRTTLRQLVERIGASTSPVKEVTAWLAEKASRLKLSRHTSGELGTFESLEALSLGILGKRALWTALAEIAPHDVRLNGLDLAMLIARAEFQYSQVERLRLAAAVALLSVDLVSFAHRE